MQVRTQYHADLERVWETLYELADLASTAMARAAAALADADRTLAEDVIGSDTELDTRRARVEELVFTLLATQQPAASINCGFTKDGLPVGLQIVGRMFDDMGVLAASQAYEMADPTFDRTPPGF